MAILKNYNSKKTPMAPKNFEEVPPTLSIKYKTIIQAVLLLTIVVEIHFILMKTAYELDVSDLFIVLNFTIFIGIHLNMSIIIFFHLLQKVMLCVWTGYLFFSRGYMFPRFDNYAVFLVIHETVSLGCVLMLYRLFEYERRRISIRKQEEDEEVSTVSDSNTKVPDWV